MNVIKTAIEGVLILEPKVFGDARGFFMESYSKKVFDEAVGYPVDFVQDNHSRSVKGVLRGLHYQVPTPCPGQAGEGDAGQRVRRRGRHPPGQRDLREMGRGGELSGENHRQFWLPPGMAHGFLVTSDSADFLYKATDFYAPQAEGALLWSDPAIGIAWPVLDVAPQLAAKDAAAPMLARRRAVRGPSLSRSGVFSGGCARHIQSAFND